MIPHENAVRQTPMNVVLAIVTPRSRESPAGRRATSCDPLGGRGVLRIGSGVLSKGAGVGVMRGTGVLLRGAGVARGSTTVPAGGVIRTPTFILKLLFPR